MPKPNFSHHWGNYLFILLAFFLGFLPTSIVFAGETVRNNHLTQMAGETMTQLHYRTMDGVSWWSSNGYHSLGWSGWAQSYKNCNINPSSKDGDGPGIDGSCNWTITKYMTDTECSAVGGSGGNPEGTSKCQKSISVRYYEHASGNCPVGTGDADGDGICNKECPAAGTEYGGSKWALNINYPNTTVNVDGCQLALEYEKVMCTDPGQAWDGYDMSNQCTRLMQPVYTGLESDNDPNPEDVPGLSQEEPQNPLQEGDHTFDEKTDTPLDTTFETMPDGTTVDQTGGTTTETKDKGLKIDEKPDTTTVEWSEGIKKTESWAETCTTQADGSKSCEWTRHLSYEQTDKDLMIVKNDDGTTTITTVPGYSGSSNTEGTTSYDSNGNKTGSTEKTSYEGDEEGQEEAREGTDEEGCEANPFSDECVGEFDEGDENSNSFDPEKGGNAYDAAVNKYQDVIDDIQSDMDSIFSAVNGGGTISADVITIRGVSGDIGITKWLPHFDAFNLAALIMAVAAFVAFCIVMGVK